jgi:hypothetical protein
VEAQLYNSRGTAVPLLLAVIGGVVGFGVTRLTGKAILGHPYELDRVLVTLGVLGAGAGWLLGVTGGLVLTRAAPPPTSVTAWALRALAALFVIAALLMPWWGLDQFGYHINFLRPMQQAVWFDSALAAVTCLVLAQRRFRREAIVIGAVVAVGILVAAIGLFAAGPCPLSNCTDPR